jgi:hypothetical protein
MEDNSHKEVSTRRNVLKELRAFRDNELLEPQTDWDLVWVLSGPEITLEEKGATGVVNENRSRLVTGFRVVREVTAKRLNKNIEDVTTDDIKDSGPKIFFNGYESHNDYFRELQKGDTLESVYHFPKEGIIVAPVGTNIQHTGTQFETFPEELLKDKRKVILVSSARHLPRIKRYIGLDNPLHKVSDRIILYPASPIQFPLGATKREVSNIETYQEKGILPKETED